MQEDNYILARENITDHLKKKDKKNKIRQRLLKIRAKKVILATGALERPKQPTELSDDEWAEFLFMRKNIKGVQFERWNHAHGCRKWFNIARDTSNDQIKAVYKMGEKPPVK